LHLLAQFRFAASQPFFSAWRAMPSTENGLQSL
jgi:hypothetical protein